MEEKRSGRKQEIIKLLVFAAAVTIIMLALAAGYNSVVPAYQ